MKKQFSDYLTSIGIKDLFHDRVEKVCSLVTNLIDSEILDIFVSEYVQDDGTRVYEGLRLFTALGLVEAEQFLTQDDFFFNRTGMCPSIGWSLKTHDYDFQQATTKSRMHLRVRLGNDLYSIFKASSENCDYLRSILIKYFIRDNATSS